MNDGKRPAHLRRSFPVCFAFIRKEYDGVSKNYIDSWNVREMTSSCCSRVRRLKLTA